ncbi:Retrovirus-related Pol polyprotein from transposon 17.6, partial [Trichinella sp. T6]
LDAVPEAKWSSTLDLASWQVEVAERDWEEIAFSTPMGLFQFEGCLVYLDDIIVYVRTEEEHLGRLVSVLHRLQSVGLKIKAKKCQLMFRSVLYPGHVRTTEWKTPRENVSYTRVTQIPLLKDIQQFLCVASY